MKYVSLHLRSLHMLALTCLVSAAWAQDDAGSARDVSEMSRGELQREIEIATEVLLARFNEVNTNRELETACRERQVTGSKLARQECKPRFLERAEAERGRQTLQGLQGPQNSDGNAGGGVGMGSNAAFLDADRGMAEMEDEMRRLINEDEEFRSLAARLGELEAALATEDETRANTGRTSAVIASAIDAPLPYDAQLMAEVAMGRNAWEHSLINRTFAIAHLYGEIEAMSLRCGAERAQFEYQLEAEWTVPDGWEDCRLTIRAPRGTTFTLFEFE